MSLWEGTLTDVAFFITGMGRSGTKWLAKLLNEAPGIRCFHEPVRNDAATYGRMYRQPSLAMRYLKWRKSVMETDPGQRWAEVNSYLRYCAPDLRATFKVPVRGLVRDGKETVESLMRRKVYARRGRPPIPAPEDAEGQFAKCCWYWADTYERLLEQMVPIFTLESLNETYAACEWLCEDVGIEIPEKVWARYAGRRIHADRRRAATLNWTAEQEEIFEDWAGDIYREVGYE